jgi:hypothetical protein
MRMLSSSAGETNMASPFLVWPCGVGCRVSMDRPTSRHPMANYGNATSSSATKQPSPRWCGGMVRSFSMSVASCYAMPTMPTTPFKRPSSYWLAAPLPSVAENPWPASFTVSPYALRGGGVADDGGAGGPENIREVRSRLKGGSSGARPTETRRWVERSETHPTKCRYEFGSENRCVPSFVRVKSMEESNGKGKRLVRIPFSSQEVVP